MMKIQLKILVKSYWLIYMVINYIIVLIDYFREGYNDGNRDSKSCGSF